MENEIKVWSLEEEEQELLYSLPHPLPGLLYRQAGGEKTEVEEQAEAGDTRAQLLQISNYLPQ